MPLKASGPATDPEFVEWDGGVSWIAYPDERMRRSSHAIQPDAGSGTGTDRAVWLVEPLDVQGLDERLAELGSVAGVVILFDHHGRDSVAVARRHGVPIYLPSWLNRIHVDAAVPVESFDDRLAGTEVRAISLADSVFWSECGLRFGETLVVPEAVGLAPYFRGGDEPLGVHPAWRLLPPRSQLADLEVERVLTGHGLGVLSGGQAALEDALAGARRRLPAAYLRGLRGFLPV